MRGVRAFAVALALTLVAVPSAVGILPKEVEEMLNGNANTPDLCDDKNTVDKPDEFNYISGGTPSRFGLGTILPLGFTTIDRLRELIEGEDGDRAEEPDDGGASVIISEGYLEYRWDVYECLDYTYKDSAAFFFYKHDAGFFGPLWSFWEEDPTYRTTEHGRVYWLCDESSIGECAFATRSMAKTMAEFAATRYPNYTTPFGTSDFGVGGWIGEFTVTSDATNLHVEMKLDGCSTALLNVCATFHAATFPL